MRSSRREPRLTVCSRSCPLHPRSLPSRARSDIRSRPLQIEYLVISYDDESKNARLSLRQTEILQDLQADADERRRTPSREESPVAAGAESVNGTAAKVLEDGQTPQKNNESVAYAGIAAFPLATC